MPNPLYSSPVMVGRSLELAVLDAALHRADGGEGRLVVVEGDAGIGKTRLVDSFARAAAERGVRVPVGYCPPLVDDVPYAPILDILRGLDASPASARIRDRGRFFRRVADLLAGQGETTMAVVEDLHWADGSTRDLLAFLSRVLRKDAVLLVVTVRGDELVPGHPVGALLAELTRDRQVDRLRLLPLTRAEVERQVCELLRERASASLVDDLFGRAEGNPFFTEELLAADGGTGRLPATVSDALHARFARLGPAAGQVLRAASVIGRSSDHLLLAAVARLPDDVLEEALRETVDHFLLVPTSDGYRFRHQLAQEAVLRAVLPGERARLHGRAARALQDRGPSSADAAPANAAELARHSEAAGEPAQALTAARLAADLAEGASSPAAAHVQYERMLRVWPETPGAQVPAGMTRHQLLLDSAESAAASGNNSRAVALVSEALLDVDRTTEPARAAVLLERQGCYALTSADQKTSRTAYEEAARLVAGAPASPERARVLEAMAQGLMLRSYDEEAISYAEQAIADARETDATPVLSIALSILGSCRIKLGRLDEGLAVLGESLALALEVNDPPAAGQAYLSLCESLVSAGQLRTALERSREGARLTRELGLTGTIAPAIECSAVRALVRLGRLSEASDLADRALSEVVERFYCQQIELQLAGLEIRRGRLDAAGELLGALDPIFTAEDVLFSAGTLRWRAELAIARGDWADALALAERGLGSRHTSGYEALGPQLCAVAVRAVAEMVEEDRGHRRRPDPAAASTEARRFADLADSLVEQVRARGGQPSPDHLGYALLARAECSRLDPAGPDPGPWERLSADRDRELDPYLAAYARRRQAEALLMSRAPRATAAPLLYAAHRSAREIGAELLARDIGDFAGRAGITLDRPAPTDPDQEPAGTGFGLTDRESEVLRLLARGLTNGEIARELFISAKTASVHVSAILRKLGVTSRIQASTMANGILGDERD
ncbi:AAA family ATPase [Streptomyces sp. NPDC060065]|uniref:helix-turn-helix transcriptional regulator n=1 Tax=Streptomyces sp. NPDC060065 TaxID=3347050 RepID=UPI003678CB16